MKKNRLAQLAALGLLAGLSSCGNNQTNSKQQRDTDPAACRGPGWEHHPEKQRTSQLMETKRLDAIKTNRS